MTPTHDTAAALWSAIDAYGCDAASHGALGKDATTRAAIDRAIAAHVAAEVARALEAAPEVEAAIVDYAHAVQSDFDAHDERNALRAAIAADKARAVEAAEDAAFIRGRDAVRHNPDGWGLIARPTPDEARSIGRVAEHLRGLAAEVEPSRMADGFEADRMRLLAHRLRQVAALMPDSDEARRLVEDLAGAQGAWVALLAGNLADSGSIAGSEAVLAARVTAARTALLRALGVEA